MNEWVIREKKREEKKEEEKEKEREGGEKETRIREKREDIDKL